MGAMIDHLSIQCADVAASAVFYDTVLATVGGTRIMEFGEVIGYGVPPMPDFWKWNFALSGSYTRCFRPLK
jgi:hypothetical protein